MCKSGNPACTEMPALKHLVMLCRPIGTMRTVVSHAPLLRNAKELQPLAKWSSGERAALRKPTKQVCVFSARLL